MNAFLKALRSKTVWGAAIVAGAGLAGGPITALGVAKAIGSVVAVAGGRDAIDKAAAVIAAAQNPN